MTIEQTTHIKNMPESERPRERLIMQGPGALSNAELLAVLVGSGTRQESSLQVAQRLLSAESSGLLFLRDCTVEELCGVPGIGRAKAAVILAAVELGRRISSAPVKKRVSAEAPEDVARLFMEEMRHLKREEFRVLLLNVKSEVISMERVSIGSVSSADAHPREVFQGALRRGASGIILVHNHPSGNPAASATDIRISKRLAEAGDILGIKVLDHIIIGDGMFVSMKTRGLF